MWFGDWYDFYIVEKELDDQTTPEIVDNNNENKKKYRETVEVV